MPHKRKIITSKAAAERAATIRRQNVQRHLKAAAVTKLREEIQRHTAVRNMQMELDRFTRGEPQTQRPGRASTRQDEPIEIHGVK